MLKLGDFFQPLNLMTLSYYLGLLLFFDILGVFLQKNILKTTKSSSSRIINWLLGLGFFIFLWFLLSLFITPGKTQVIISAFVLLLVSLPDYIRKKRLRELFKSLWHYKVPILIIAPLLPSVFIKASLPPYYADEMSYHFLAPNFLQMLGPIKYIGYLYTDIPRLLDLFWQITFTLFHTYSVARLFHFFILATSMVFAYAVLKKDFGTLVAAFFVFLFFSLPQNIVFTSTLGYVDVGAYSFLLIAIVSAIDFLIKRNKDSLIFASIFWAMNLGTKYTGLTSFVSFLSVFSIVVVYKKKLYRKLFSWKLILTLGVLAVVFGGYWYIKNFILFGNPIFPFIFHCWGPASVIAKCPATSSFFGTWTTKITIYTLFPILKELLPRNPILWMLVVISPIISFWSKNKNIRLITYFVLAVAGIEMIILKYFSGFVIRYQQHIQFYLLIAAILVLVDKYKIPSLNLLMKLALISLILYSSFYYFKNIFFFNSLRFLNWNEINYAIGEINIYDWVDLHFPEMKDTIKWCESPPSGNLTALERFDPDLIWFSREGGMRAYMTNCYYPSPPLQGTPISKVLETAKEEKLQFWVASLNKCISEDSPNFDNRQIQLRKLNNIIICNAKEVKPNVYYFDYTQLK